MLPIITCAVWKERAARNRKGLSPLLSEIGSKDSLLKQSLHIGPFRGRAKFWCGKGLIAYVTASLTLCVCRLNKFCMSSFVMLLVMLKDERCPLKCNPLALIVVGESHTAYTCPCFWLGPISDHRNLAKTTYTGLWAPAGTELYHPQRRQGEQIWRWGYVGCKEYYTKPSPNRPWG